MVFAGAHVRKSKRGTPFLGCRCVFINDEQDGYNVCDELISADDISYACVDVENRTIARTQSATSSASYGDTLDLCETAKLLLKSLETGGNG